VTFQRWKTGFVQKAGKMMTTLQHHCQGLPAVAVAALQKGRSKLQQKCHQVTRRLQQIVDDTKSQPTCIEMDVYACRIGTFSADTLEAQTPHMQHMSMNKLAGIPVATVPSAVITSADGPGSSSIKPFVSK
jgi:hypothetical protein